MPTQGNAGDSLAWYGRQAGLEVAVAMPEDTPEHILLLYETFRPALAPFVIGLLHGLAEMVKTPIEVDHLEAKGEEHDADLFGIRLVAA